MISVIVDNNVFVSAFLRGGKPLAVLDAVGFGYGELLSTDAIMQQLEQVLKRPKFQPDFAQRGIDIFHLLNRYQRLARYVTPTIIPEIIVRDEEDKRFIECAVGGKADYLISGGQDLTTIGIFRGIPILPPAQFLIILNPPLEHDPDATVDQSGKGSVLLGQMIVGGKRANSSQGHQQRQHDQHDQQTNDDQRRAHAEIIAKTVIARAHH